ncbi:hypothetical protein [Plantactinospora sp. B5E13]|uniref:tetratricopeptide repeat protein n=1 Tax=unclassified Plantactinospora TaxID=2631981 RepID=UPI00325F3843
MNDALAEARELIEAGDPAAAARRLRAMADPVPLGDLAPVVERLARLVGLDDLAGASARLAADPDRTRTLYDFGYACVEHDLAFLAVPALTEALRRAPDADGVLAELAVALEEEQRHAEAVAALERRGDSLPAWPHRYLLVYNALMAGDLERAGRHLDRLPAPEDGDWRPAHERVTRMVARAALLVGEGALDRRDLRGWHFVLTGGVLGTLSPYGFDAGMTGRYAYQQDSFDLCRLGLDRLRLVLTATGRRPESLALLPDRSSRILGLAAAELLGLPAVPFGAERRNTLVVAYDLTEVEDRDVLGALRERAAGEILFEHGTCWTSPPPVSADVSTLLAQFLVAPWGERLRQRPDGSVGQEPADDRSVEELASEVVRAQGEPDAGDGETPPDPDETLARFGATVVDGWLTGPRDRVRSSGPVPSSRFS